MHTANGFVYTTNFGQVILSRLVLRYLQGTSPRNLLQGESQSFFPIPHITFPCRRRRKYNIRPILKVGEWESFWRWPAATVVDPTYSQPLVLLSISATMLPRRMCNKRETCGSGAHPVSKYGGDPLPRGPIKFRQTLLGNFEPN